MVDVITEPIETIVAIALITIAVASVIAYSTNVSRTGVLQERLLARSVASVVAETYAADYVMGDLNYSEFATVVGALCEAIANRSGTWVGVNITLSYLGGAQEEYFINSSGPKPSWGEVVLAEKPTIPLTLVNTTMAYGLPYRDFFYSQDSGSDWTWEEMIFYIVAYHPDGMPAEGAWTQVRVNDPGSGQLGIANNYTLNGICKLTIDSGTLSGSAPADVQVFLRCDVDDDGTWELNDEQWIDVPSGPLTGRGENQMLHNSTGDPWYHFFAGENISGQGYTEYNISNRKGTVKYGTDGPEFILSGLNATQGPYNATIGTAASKAYVPMFLYPYTMIVQVEVIVPKG